MIKVVLFDWSGTLCDDYSAVHQKINKVIPPHLAKNIFFHPLIKHLRSLFPIAIMRLLPFKYSPSDTKMKLFPHTKEVIVFLKQRGVVVGIISTQSPKIITDILRKEKLYSSINVIKGYALYKYNVIKQLECYRNSKKHDIAYISDIREDLEEAKPLGIKVYAASWGYDTKENLQKALPDGIFSSIISQKSLFK